MPPVSLAPGHYWVETGYGWTVAYWNDDHGEWWLAGWQSGRDLPSFLRIGERIEPPAGCRVTYA